VRGPQPAVALLHAVASRRPLRRTLQEQRQEASSSADLCRCCVLLLSLVLIRLAYGLHSRSLAK
jgi:hypothetical protein